MNNVDEISLIIFSITSVWLLFGSIGLKTTFFIGQLMQVWYWKALLLLYMYAYWFIITDIDECSDGSNTCLSYATCTDTIGTYTCKCPEKGFKGDGHECTGLRNKQLIRNFASSFLLFMNVFILFNITILYLPILINIT